MEQKRLDFNAPLLSVRRFSSTTASSEENKNKKVENPQHQEKKPILPFYKSELKSGPVRNPGAVPFCWEQIPGRPKDEGRALLRPPERLPITPKLPPGRTSAIKQQTSNTEFEKPNVGNRSSNENVIPSCKKVSHSYNKATELNTSQEDVKEGGDSDFEESDDDNDDAFMDALDTLSRTESFFLNCSVTGLSGLDGPNMTSGVSSTDPQARDFMMNRFLPAAKAMASETPQYALRKKPVVVCDQPREVKKVINSERKTPIHKYRAYIAAQSHVQDAEEEESEDEDDEYDHTADLSAKACGLLPNFCLKNSFCLLNPVPGMKVRSQVPIHSVRKVRTQIKTADSESHTATNNENNWEAVYKHKLLSGLDSIDDESKRTSESNQLTCWSDSQTPDGSSSCRHSVGGGISPYRNEASQSPFHEGVGFLGMPKQVKNLKVNGSDWYNNSPNSAHETMFHRNNKQRSGNLSPLAEKTLYVDSEQVLETAKSNLSSSDAKELMECTDKDFEIPTASQGMEETPMELSCLRDTNGVTVSNQRGVIQSKSSEVINADLASYPNGSKRLEYFTKAFSLDQDSKSLDSKVPISGLLEFNKALQLMADDSGNSDLNSFHAPLPPPLPKSPSESWLWRTLPSIPSRNTARFVPRKRAVKTSSTDSKWEIIVKTSNV